MLTHVKILPLAILAGLNLIGLGIAMEKCGKPIKEGTHGIGGTILGTILEWGLILWAIL